MGMNERRMNERTLKAKQYILECLDGNKEFNRDGVMAEFKISDSTYYKALRIATDERGLVYEDYLDNSNMSHPGHAARNMTYEYTPPIDPSVVSQGFDTVISELEKMHAEMSQEIEKHDLAMQETVVTRM